MNTPDTALQGQGTTITLFDTSSAIPDHESALIQALFASIDPRRHERHAALARQPRSDET